MRLRRSICGTALLFRTMHPNEQSGSAARGGGAAIHTDDSTVKQSSTANRQAEPENIYYRVSPTEQHPDWNARVSRAPPQRKRRAIRARAVSRITRESCAMASSFQHSHVLQLVAKDPASSTRAFTLFLQKALNGLSNA